MIPPATLRSTRDAWRKYASTGALSAQALRAPVYRAWERCHDLGTSPLQPQAEALSAQQTQTLLAEKSSLVQAARPFLAALSRAAGGERHAAMLGDARAVVLDIVGDEETVHGPEPFPGPGALLAEEVSGANGIGTPLAGGGYVELVGPEHFIGGFHAFTCQGVPVRAPDGTVAGVISSSVRRVEASRRLREILVCAARGMEAELLRAQLEDDVRQVLASANASTLGRLRDDVVQSWAAARVRLETAARRAPVRGLRATLALVAEAQRAIDRFGRQATLWRELASSELGVAHPLSVDELVGDILELLGTEARVRRLEVQQTLEPTRIHADPRALAREVFAILLAAFEAARPGGAVRVWLRAPSPRETASLSVRGEPASGPAPFERVHSFTGLS